jgi:tetratricopeptide (TPR) repeat protein
LGLSWIFRLWLLCQASASLLHGAKTAAELFRTAQVLEKQGDMAAAERLYRRVLALDPRSAEAAANLGVVLVRQGRYQESIRQYQRALRLKPELYALHLNLGLALLHLGQPRQAAMQFEAYLKRQPGDRRARQLLATALLESDQYERAAHLYEQLLPGDASVHLGLGAAYARLGRREEAEREFGAALGDGESPAALLAIGHAYLAWNDFARAESTLLRAAQLDPRLSGLHFALGACYWKQQRTEKAIEHWRQEAQLDPNSFEANFVLGAALVEAKQDSAAEPYLRKAVRLRPQHGLSLYYLGRVLWKRGDLEGLRLLARSVELEPENRAAHYLLARAYQQRGQKTRAARHFAALDELVRRKVSEDIDIVAGAGHGVPSGKPVAVR